MASSTELSTTSHTRWCSPVGPVEPMYIPGRLRTASSPSRMVMSASPYVLPGVSSTFTATGAPFQKLGIRGAYRSPELVTTAFRCGRTILPERRANSASLGGRFHPSERSPRPLSERRRDHSRRRRTSTRSMTTSIRVIPDPPEDLTCSKIRPDPSRALVAQAGWSAASTRTAPSTRRGRTCAASCGPATSSQRANSASMVSTEGGAPRRPSSLGMDSASGRGPGGCPRRHSYSRCSSRPGTHRRRVLIAAPVGPPRRAKPPSRRTAPERPS